MMKTKKLVLVALFAATLCVVSPISIPIGVVPVSLTTFVVFVAASVLGAKKAVWSVLIYILLGMVGMPVFAGFSGGLYHLVSPTGGFVISYVLCALITGHFWADSIKKNIAVMSAANLICYIIGTAWFVMHTKVSLLDATLVCIIPFVLTDAIKIVSAAIVSDKLKKHFSKS